MCMIAKLQYKYGTRSRVPGKPVACNYGLLSKGVKRQLVLGNLALQVGWGCCKVGAVGM